MKGMCDKSTHLTWLQVQVKSVASSQEMSHRMPDVRVRFFLKNYLWVFSHARVKLFSVVYKNFSQCQKLWLFSVCRVATNQSFLEILRQWYALFLEIYFLPHQPQNSEKMEERSKLRWDVEREKKERICKRRGKKSQMLMLYPQCFSPLLV